MSAPTAPLNLFQRAARRLPLTPEERAILKFVMLSIMTATIAGITAVVTYLGSGGKTVNWQIVFYLFIGPFILTLGETYRKWVSANGDGPLGAALQLMTEAAKRSNVGGGVADLLKASTKVSSAVSPEVSPAEPPHAAK